MYVTSCAKKQVRHWNDLQDLYCETAERPVAEIFTALGTDGQPAALAQKMLATNAKNGYNTFPRSTFVFAGSFSHRHETAEL